MARADVLKKLLRSYQRRDDRAFREVVAQIIEEERRKHHPVLANELEQIINNGSENGARHNGFTVHDRPPQDADRGSAAAGGEAAGSVFWTTWCWRTTISKLVDRLVYEFRSWEILEANGLSPTRRVLFCGPSGCGKTVAAEAIASELGLPMLYVRFDAVVSSLLGETASNLRKVFDYARRGQWVMFFDEFDAIGRSRDDPTEHGEIKRVVNSFLQILDNYQGTIAGDCGYQLSSGRLIRPSGDGSTTSSDSRSPLLSRLSGLVEKRLKPFQFTTTQVKQLVRWPGGRDLRRCRAGMPGYSKNGHPGREDVRSRQQDIADALDRYAYRRTVFQRSVEDAMPTSG
jgi:hypothetical protein